MAYNYSTTATYTAYLASWSEYLTGGPVGPHKGASTFLAIPAAARLQIRQRCFVKPDEMKAAEQQKEFTLTPLAVCKEVPLDLVFTTEDDEDEAIFFPATSPEPEDDDESEEEEETTPSPPPPKLTKRKREPTPDESSSSSSESDSDVVRPKCRKKVKFTSPLTQTESDGQLARKLHDQMNGRRSRRQS